MKPSAAQLRVMRWLTALEGRTIRQSTVYVGSGRSWHRVFYDCISSSTRRFAIKPQTFHTLRARAWIKRVGKADIDSFSTLTNGKWKQIRRTETRRWGLTAKGRREMDSTVPNIFETTP